MKILIVDDSKAMRMLVQRALRQAGLEDLHFAEATNGSEALEIATADPFDLILSDWNMPEMSGLDLLRALRAAGSKVAFGFITSDSSEAMRHTALRSGAKFVVVKPFTPEAFQAAMGIE